MFSFLATWIPTTPAAVTPEAPASTGCQTVAFQAAASHSTAMSWATFGLIALAVIALVAVGAWVAQNDS